MHLCSARAALQQSVFTRLVKVEFCLPMPRRIRGRCMWRRAEECLADLKRPTRHRYATEGSGLSIPRRPPRVSRETTPG